MKLEYRVLGPLEVRGRGRSVPLGGSKQRALLGVLLLRANEVVPLSLLVDDLWGESPPATAGKLVQGYVHALRKWLGDGALVTQPPGYRLQVAPDALDLLEFRRLIEAAREADPDRATELRRAALELWRGPPLADVTLAGPTAHEVARLTELHLTTQIEQIDAELACGHHAVLVGELDTLVAEHPYQERLHAQLILALFRSGRQADALAASRAVRRSLRDELGLEPGTELRELELAILRQDPILGVELRPTPAHEDDGAQPERPSRSRRGLALAATVLVAVLAAAAGVIAATRSHHNGLGSVHPNSVGVIDPATNRIVGEVRVGRRPGPVAVTGDAIWVGNLDDRNLTRIGARQRAVEATVDLAHRTPTALAAGAGALWVAHGLLGQLSRVDVQFDRVTATLEIAPAQPVSSAAVASGAGAIWVVYGDSTLARVDPTAVRVAARSYAGAAPVGAVVAAGLVWIVNGEDATVYRYNPATFVEGPVAPSITLGSRPTAVAYGAGAIWVACAGDDAVTRIDPADGSAQTIPVGDRPTAIAVGEGAVWVANTGDRTISRIDPSTQATVSTIPVGAAPTGVAVGDGYVWFAVQAP